MISTHEGGAGALSRKLYAITDLAAEKESSCQKSILALLFPDMKTVNASNFMT